MSIQGRESIANCGQVSSALLIVTLILAVALFWYFRVQQICGNIEEAKSSGLKFVVLPFFIFSTPWAITQAVFLPLLDRLPESWTESWLPYIIHRLFHECLLAEFTLNRLLTFTRGWHYGYEPFGKIGTDTSVVVSPTRNVLYTCDPNVITQLFRGNTFGKPTELLKMLNIFGPTLTGTNGDEARQYRKITAPFFNEQTLHQVWINSVNSIETTLKLLVKSQTVDHFRGLRPILAWMTLRILNVVGFEGKRNFLAGSGFSDEVLPDHALSYSRAMHSVLDHFGTIHFNPSPSFKYFPPKFSLKIPSRVLRKSYQTIHLFRCTRGRAKPIVNWIFTWRS